MMPLPLRVSTALHRDLTPAEEAIARSVLYSALFDYPLTLSQLRRTLIASAQTPSEILSTLRGSPVLADLIEHAEGYFFPVGRRDLIATRRAREARSRHFFASHRLLLRIIAALPYVQMVGLSGSIAHLNLESGGDLDLFLVTRGRRVWTTAVVVVLLARLLGRRRTLCANFIVADTALHFPQEDLFTASQVINLKPLTGAGTYRRILSENPFVRRFYPNFHSPDCGGLRLHQSAALRAARRAAEFVLTGPSSLLERVCRIAYRAYLGRRSSTWQSPEQVVLGDSVLKLHTRSHRQEILSRFDQVVRSTLD